ncbi:hypothetical protein CANTEDRAFT_113021 [Yamadazyma tenuis ATCC 10573]|uniref:Uncharacterized protein n=2 Tax=Candida tenuis TaxID=2315449 RepID=G3B004_CANTC|nr:uncharacterized protein CANTEDRAFT_113021 [Yamadazyma tenuis ATCC 10573]EGV65283.1 hypothetical protein CANTEDRAFT_113021 [Yamadazyma tenuis ATCC 10573]
MLLHTLVLLEGKLQYLNLQFEVMNFDHTKHLYSAILSHQWRLKSLILYDKSNEFFNEKQMVKHLKAQFSQFEKTTFYLQLFYKTYPISLEPYKCVSGISSIYKTFFSENQDALSVYLADYLKSVGLKSPPTSLEQFVVNNVPLVVLNGSWTFMDAAKTPILFPDSKYPL